MFRKAGGAKVPAGRPVGWPPVFPIKRRCTIRFAISDASAVWGRSFCAGCHYGRGFGNLGRYQSRLKKFWNLTNFSYLFILTIQIILIYFIKPPKQCLIIRIIKKFERHFPPLFLKAIMCSQMLNISVFYISVFPISDSKYVSE